MSQIQASDGEKLFWQKMKEAFVQTVEKDAIADAAVDQLAFDLHQYNLVSDFVRLFNLEAIETQDPAHSQAPAIYSDSTSFERLSPLLQKFVENLHVTESGTGVSNLQPDMVPDVAEVVKIHAGHIYDAAKPRSVYEAFRAAKENRKHETRDDPNEQCISYLKLSSVLEHLELKALPSSVLSLDSKTEHITRLSAALQEAETESAITCRGSIPLRQLEIPAVLRFDASNSSQGKVNFSCMASEVEGASTQIHSLVSQCQEATFGLDGKDVLDKNYRNALKMDPTDFSISFHPFDHRILDAISGLLLPNRPVGGLRVVLYKLNIYGPGGKFKSHIDTPRSLQQFGSLVVCLPSTHKGGELVIRHNGRITEHSWGNSTSSLEWAAFYSDCEHEVLEVTQGFRITLTYNLYWDPLNQPLANPPLAIRHLPLYQEVHTALTDPHFLPRGGTIGFHCAHLYPRNRQGSNEGVPYCLKGVDRALWLVLQSLNVPQGVHLVFDQRKVKEDVEDLLEREEYMSDEESPEDARAGSASPVLRPEERQILEAYQREVSESGNPPTLQYEESDPTLLPESTFAKRLDQLLDCLKVRGLVVRKPKLDESGQDRVNNIFESVRIGSDCEQGIEKAEMFDEFSTAIKGIHWLNEQRNLELAMAYLAYGNQAELDTYYASAAILARIPPYSEGRGAAGLQHQAAADRGGSTKDDPIVL